ncbi:MAG: hypothetical protein P1U34_04810 [Coxiellaceae bacterium]|nr:hypothetical protein [Coxiellaceae bacterium]
MEKLIETHQDDHGGESDVWQKPMLKLLSFSMSEGGSSGSVEPDGKQLFSP